MFLQTGGGGKGIRPNQTHHNNQQQQQQAQSQTQSQDPNQQLQQQQQQQQTSQQQQQSQSHRSNRHDHRNQRQQHHNNNHHQQQQHHQTHIQAHHSQQHKNHQSHQSPASIHHSVLAQTSHLPPHQHQQQHHNQHLQQQQQSQLAQNQALQFFPYQLNQGQAAVAAAAAAAAAAVQAQQNVNNVLQQTAQQLAPSPPTQTNVMPNQQGLNVNNSSSSTNLSRQQHAVNNGNMQHFAPSTPLLQTPTATNQAAFVASYLQQQLHQQTVMISQYGNNVNAQNAQNAANVLFQQAQQQQNSHAAAAALHTHFYPTAANAGPGGPAHLPHLQQHQLRNVLAAAATSQQRQQSAAYLLQRNPGMYGLPTGPLPTQNCPQLLTNHVHQANAGQNAGVTVGPLIPSTARGGGGPGGAFIAAPYCQPSLQLTAAALSQPPPNLLAGTANLAAAPPTFSHMPGVPTSASATSLPTSGVTASSSNTESSVRVRKHAIPIVDPDTNEVISVSQFGKNVDDKIKTEDGQTRKSYAIPVTEPPPSPSTPPLPLQTSTSIMPPSTNIKQSDESKNDKGKNIKNSNCLPQTATMDVPPPPLENVVVEKHTNSLNVVDENDGGGVAVAEKEKPLALQLADATIDECEASTSTLNKHPADVFNVSNQKMNAKNVEKQNLFTPNEDANKQVQENNIKLLNVIYNQEQQQKAVFNKQTNDNCEKIQEKPNLNQETKLKNNNNQLNYEDRNKKANNAKQAAAGQQQQQQQQQQNKKPEQQQQSKTANKNRSNSAAIVPTVQQQRLQLKPTKSTTSTTSAVTSNMPASTATTMPTVTATKSQQKFTPTSSASSSTASTPTHKNQNKNGGNSAAAAAATTKNNDINQATGASNTSGVGGAHVNAQAAAVVGNTKKNRKTSKREKNLKKQKQIEVSNRNSNVTSNNYNNSNINNNNNITKDNLNNVTQNNNNAIATKTPTDTNNENNNLSNNSGNVNNITKSNDNNVNVKTASSLSIEVNKHKQQQQQQIHIQQQQIQQIHQHLQQQNQKQKTQTKNTNANNAVTTNANNNNNNNNKNKPHIRILTKADLKCSHDTMNEDTRTLNSQKREHIKAQDIVEQYLQLPSNCSKNIEDQQLQFLNSSSSACEEEGDDNNLSLKQISANSRPKEQTSTTIKQQTNTILQTKSSTEDLSFGDFSDDKESIENDITDMIENKVPKLSQTNAIITTKSTVNIPKVDTSISVVPHNLKITRSKSICLTTSVSSSSASDFVDHAVASTSAYTKKMARNQNNAKPIATSRSTNNIDAPASPTVTAPASPMSVPPPVPFSSSAKSSIKSPLKTPITTPPPTSPVSHNIIAVANKSNDGVQKPCMRYSLDELRSIRKSSESQKPPMVPCQKGDCISQLFVSRQQHHHHHIPNLNIHQHLQQQYQHMSFNESIEFVSGKRRGGGQIKKHHEQSGAGISGNLSGNIGSVLGANIGGIGNVNLNALQHQQQRNKMDIIRVNLSLKEEIKLSECENAWMPATLRGNKHGGNVPVHKVAETLESVLKKVRGVLNKLTPDNFDVLLKSMSSVQLDTTEKMQKVMLLIFEKTVREPNFAPTYARFCKILFQEIKAESKTLFTNSLILRIQQEFETNVNDADAKRMKLQPLVSRLETTTDAKERFELQAEIEDQEYQFRRRAWGTVRFIGEMYKLQSLTSDRVFLCIESLLDHGSEEKLEYMCKLLTTVGHLLEGPEQFVNNRMDKIFRRIQEIVNKARNNKAQTKISSRVRFMMQDVIDLRARIWDQPHQTANAQNRRMGGSSNKHQQQHHNDDKSTHNIGNSASGSGGSGGNYDKNSNRLSNYNQQGSASGGGGVGRGNSGSRQNDMRSDGMSGGTYFLGKQQQQQKSFMQQQEKLNIDVNKLKFSRGEDVLQSTTKLGNSSTYLWRTAGRSTGMGGGGAGAQTNAAAAAASGPQTLLGSVHAQQQQHNAFNSFGLKRQTNQFMVLEKLDKHGMPVLNTNALTQQKDLFSSSSSNATPTLTRNNSNVENEKPAYTTKECQDLVNVLVDEVIDKNSWNEEALKIWHNSGYKQQVSILHYILTNYLHLAIVKRAQRIACAKIFTYLMRTKDFDRQVYTHVYTQFAEEFPDLLVDVPNGWQYVFEFLGPMLHEHLLDFSDIWLPQWMDDKYFTQRFVKALINYFTTEYGANYMRNIWHVEFRLGKGHHFMTADVWNDFIESNGYQFIYDSNMKPPQINQARNLQLNTVEHVDRIEFLLNTATDCDLAMDYINTNVNITTNFIRNLTKFLCCDYATSVMTTIKTPTPSPNASTKNTPVHNSNKQNKQQQQKQQQQQAQEQQQSTISKQQLNCDLFRNKCTPLLRRCIDAREAYEISCIDSIVDSLKKLFDNTTSNELICNVFNILYDCEVIAKESFDKWYRGRRLHEQANNNTIDNKDSAGTTTTTKLTNETTKDEKSPLLHKQQATATVGSGSKKQQKQSHKNSKNANTNANANSNITNNNINNSSNCSSAENQNNTNDRHNMMSDELHAFMEKLLNI